MFHQLIDALGVDSLQKEYDDLHPHDLVTAQIATSRSNSWTSTHWGGSGMARKGTDTFKVGLGWDAVGGVSSWKNPRLVAQLSILGRWGSTKGSSLLHWSMMGTWGAASWTSEEQMGTDQFVGLSLRRVDGHRGKNEILGQVMRCVELGAWVEKS